MFKDYNNTSSFRCICLESCTVTIVFVSKTGISIVLFLAFGSPGLLNSHRGSPVHIVLSPAYFYPHVSCPLNVNYLSKIPFFLLSPSCSVQDYFVRLANQKKGMLASSHLVLQSPEGTKYQAAKKWGLPAVTMNWILESARTGQKAEEGRFLVDLPPSPG